MDARLGDVHTQFLKALTKLSGAVIRRVGKKQIFSAAA
jgi:hypothetical protein